MTATAEMTDTSTDIKTFFSALSLPGDFIELRAIHDDEEIESRWFKAENIEQAIPWMTEKNEQGFNIYFGVNPRPKHGVKSDANIRLARVLVSDFDGGCTHEQAIERISKAGLPPANLANFTGHGVHTYWILNAPCTDLAAWRQLQKDLATKLGADTKIQNPERVMRVPGFWNCKDVPVLSRLIDYSPGLNDFNAIRAAVPVTKETTPPPANPIGIPSRRENAGGIMSAVERCIKYLDKCPDAISGEKGHDRALYASTTTRRFGLDDGEAWNVLSRFNSTKCRPPFNEKDLRHKLSEGLKLVNAKGEFGIKLRNDRPANHNGKHNGNGQKPPAADPGPAPSFGEDEQTPAETPDLIPLSDPDPPPFPTGIFSGWLGDYVKALSDATETPIELAAGATLALIATSVQGKISVSPERNYFEQLSYYGAAFLNSGERKSAVINAVIAPAIEWESEKRAELDPQIKRLTAERSTMQQRIKKLREKAATTGDKTAMDEVTELETALPEIPIVPRAIAQDCTPEHTATMMARNGGHLGIFSDEGGFFDSLGRYSKDSTPNMDLVLQAYSGTPVRIDRGSRESIALNHPALSIYITPQPSVAAGLASKPGFRGRGLLARFSYAAPLSRLGNRTLIPRPIPEETTRYYSEYIKALLNLLTPAEEKRSGPHVLQFDPEAYAAWKAFQHRIEKMMADGGSLHALTDVGGKMPGMCARLAGLLHVADYATGAIDNRTISPETMQRAIALADFYLAHALTVFGIMGADAALTAARRLWAEIEKLGQISFTAREAWQPTRRAYPRIEDIEPGFRVLIERGWLLESDEDNNRKPGRPSRRFTVNPKAAEGFALIAHGSQGER